MNSYITFGLVIVLLLCQVLVLLALLVVIKQYRALKKVFEDNQASIHLASVRRPTDVKNEDGNKYIEGGRDPSTLVRSYSNVSRESVVWVPTPSTKRRSQGLNDELNTTTTTDVPTSHVDAQENFVDEEDEIYANQVIVDMRRVDNITDNTQYTIQGFEHTIDDESEDIGVSTDPIYENYLQGSIYQTDH